MTYIDRIERDADRKGAPRADRYFSTDVVATIHCKVSCTIGRTCLVGSRPALVSAPRLAVRGRACIWRS